MNFYKLDAVKIREGINKGDFSAEEVTKSFLKRAADYNEKLNAYITINDRALDEAREIDKQKKLGKQLGKLAGVPVAVKDMLCTEGLKTTAASKILGNFIPPYSATVVERLKSSGAIVIGKANCDEFAMGSSTENSAFGPCLNPWNLDYVPGGSSGGSAAAVAGQLATIAIGTDTGGSIRQPANFCGIVGIKPTYGRVSRYGIVAFASSLDQAGPMTRNVLDAAVALEVIAGLDGRDTTSSSRQVPQWSQNINSDISGLTLGIPKEYMSDKIDPEVKKIIQTTIDKLKSNGCKFVDVSLPSVKHAVAIYYLVCASEASSNLARYDGVRFGYRYGDGSNKMNLETLYMESRGRGFGSEVKRRIMIGTYALSSGYYEAYYKKACQVRHIMRGEFLEAYKKCDAIISPVTTSPAFKIDERIKDPLTMYLNDIFTISANLAGVPGISVPAGFAKNGMPVGVQLMGKHFDEQTLFNVAKNIEDSVSDQREFPDVLQ